MSARHCFSAPARQQRGVGAVVMVMVLFFVVSLMAAYASRNLIFEQKTSANQVRSTVAFEAADAAVEWTVTMLNAGRINDDCGVGTSGDSSFQQRYLAVDSSGNFRVRVRTGNWPTCVFNGTDWSCKCPDASTLNLTSPTTGAGPFPAFRVWPATQEAVSLVSSPYTPVVTFPLPGMISVGTGGCSVLPAAGSGCLDFLPRGQFGEAVGNTRVAMMLRSALAVPPAAAITVRRGVTPGGGAVKLKVINENEPSGGYTVNGGLAVTPTDFDATTLPGTPGSVSFAGLDPRLSQLEAVATAAGSLTAGERMFASIFGMKRQTYKEQPGLRVCTSPCDAAKVNDLLLANPNRIIWVEGNLAADANIGSSGSPAMLVVEGNQMTMSTGVTITGVVYLSGENATIQLPAGATAIQGALIAEGALATTYASTPAAGQELTVTYNRPVLDLIRNTFGSWVRMPGGWRDFKSS